MLLFNSFLALMLKFGYCFSGCKRTSFCFGWQAGFISNRYWCTEHLINHLFASVALFYINWLYSNNMRTMISTLCFIHIEWNFMVRTLNLYFSFPFWYYWFCLIAVIRKNTTNICWCCWTRWCPPGKLYYASINILVFSLYFIALCLFEDSW